METFIKKMFDMIPLDGKKTYLSILATVLGFAAQLFPEYPVLDHINGFVLQIAGLLGVTVGAYHKDLKLKQL